MYKLVSMRVQDAADYYDSRTALALALEVRPSAVSNWDTRYNGVIPELYARRLHEMTRGRLRFDSETYRKRRGQKP